MLLVVGVSALVTACGLLTILAITSETGPLGLVTGAFLASLPVFPVVMAFLWLDRYEAEPASLLLFAFAWGAGVATFGSLIVNTASVAALKSSGGDPTLGSIVVAPVVEEVMKGLAVLLILIVRRREFDGIVDGIVYAGLCGIGFACIENILYLGRAMQQDGVSGTVFVFVLRCVVSPFAHPLFTAATGVAIGVAARSARRTTRLLAPPAGLLVAICLHGAWNLSAASGLNGFITIYILLQLPVLAAVVALALMARRREGRLIGRHLTVYSSTGWLSHGEVGMLSSLSARKEARSWARRSGGPGAHRAMRDFQELGSELAFLRDRVARGTACADAMLQEQAMLAAMSDLRSRFLPQWSA
ncbi:MAG: PrsW family intrarane metalloprotease [Actinomycetota bacterium]|nr:PrsW family intrarane metalloprotease [Actinomycetota bacterium]